MPASSNPYQRAVDLTYETVGGWMLFLCIALSLLRPTIGGFQIYLEASAFGWAQANFVSRAIFVSALGIEVGIIAFGIVAGIALWTLRPSGVWLAKCFLIAQCVVPILFLLGLVAFLKTAGANPDAVIKVMWPAILRALIYGTIWWLYLVRSKRVKRTYELQRQQSGGEALG